MLSAPGFRAKPLGDSTALGCIGLSCTEAALLMQFETSRFIRHLLGTGPDGTGLGFRVD